eukprot:4726243-Amphidinium_carterae.1
MVATFQQQPKQATKCRNLFQGEADFCCEGDGYSWILHHDVTDLKTKRKQNICKPDRGLQSLSSMYYRNLHPHPSPQTSP